MDPRDPDRIFANNYGPERPAAAACAYAHIAAYAYSCSHRHTTSGADGAPQIAAFPPQPTSEPKARGGIRGGGICPGVAALPLAVASLAWTCCRKTRCNLTDGKPLDFSAHKG